jgi:manganese efflux pump family protein
MIMVVAALIAWLVTALGGFYLLATWIAKGGARAPRTSKFPPALIFGHFAVAAVGLVLWIVYVVARTQALAWVSFVLLAVVAVLGFTMLFRWIPTYRESRVAVPAGGSAAVPAERHFPVLAVGGHGLLAVVTVVTVLLAALGV